ncbi:MAG TPA: S53 family peptidase [Trebonia sp.]|nr:S53 family peptidase [Trebonia sp.]
MPELVPLSGSERSELPTATPAATPIDPSQVITVTVLLRRRAELPADLINTTATVSTEELGERYGADPADATHVADVLGRYGLTVTEFQLASRRLKVSGMIAAMTAAFGTELTAVTSDHPDGTGSVTHRYRTGGLSVPAELSGIIVGVLGLDNRPQASPHFRRPAPAGPEGGVMAHAAGAAQAAVPLTALQVASLYDFPAGTDGTGQTIAIIELGGGYTAADLTTYFGGLSLPVPSVTSVDVDNGSNSPGQAADGEVELDIEVAGAVAPKASFVVYFAPNTDQGFIDAISDAVNAKPTPIAVSISWGGPESSWTAQTMTGMNQAIADAAALGATVTVASGDNGSSDNAGSTSGVAVDFPASSPYSLACGGTTLIGNAATSTITSEVVWNEIAKQAGAGGGGVSVVYAQPAWQKSAGVPATAATGVTGIGSAAEPGRGVPDVAGNADPYSGYQVVVDGKPEPIGGTSAVAPLWAGLIARLAQASGKRFGLLQPLLYAGITAGVEVAGFRDIVDGGNGAYKAGPGWDACTGLGSPNGTALLARLTGTSTPPPPPTAGPTDPTGSTSGSGSPGSGSSEG